MEQFAMCVTTGSTLAAMQYYLYLAPHAAWAMLLPKSFAQTAVGNLLLDVRWQDIQISIRLCRYIAVILYISWIVLSIQMTYHKLERFLFLIFAYHKAIFLVKVYCFPCV